MSEIKQVNLAYQSNLLAFYSAIRDLPYKALLDSNHEHFSDTQFDILVANPLARVRAHQHQTNASAIEWFCTPLYELAEHTNPMTLLDELMTRICQEKWAQNAPKDLPFTGGLLGYYGYESGHFVEKLPDTVNHDIALDTLHIGLYGWAVITNHQTKTTQLMYTPWCQEEEVSALINRFTSANDDVLVHHDPVGSKALYPDIKFSVQYEPTRIRR